MASPTDGVITFVALDGVFTEAIRKRHVSLPRWPRNSRLKKLPLSSENVIAATANHRLGAKRNDGAEVMMSWP